MLTKAQNALLTQTSPGTACGELMRRYWQPVALSSELVADIPVPVQVLGESLVLFRENARRSALIARHIALRVETRAEVDSGSRNSKLRAFYQMVRISRAPKAGISKPAPVATPSFLPIPMASVSKSSPSR